MAKETVDFPWFSHNKIVIFHSYASLPEGTVFGEIPVVLAKEIPGRFRKQWMLATSHWWSGRF